MGNAKKDRQKTMINVVLPSGFGMAKVVEVDSLSVPLVEINQQLLTSVRLGTVVHVLMKDGYYFCFVDGEKLGKISSNYAERVTHLGRSIARIISIWRTPASVTIKF